jgi:flavodoxin
MKTMVYYYSRKNSNRFLAKKISGDLNCGIEEIKSRLNAHLLMLMGLNFGNRKLKSNVEDYDRVILCGPIWMGKLIVPLKNFVLKHSGKIHKLVFVTCCGSPFEKKDEKFGHNLVFNEVKRITGETCIHCEAFPITLVLPDDQKEDTDAFMKTHLNDDNFKGEIAAIYERFIKSLLNS